METQLDNLQERYQNQLSQYMGTPENQGQIRNMVMRNMSTFSVDLDQLRRSNQKDLADELIKNPQPYLRHLHNQLKDRIDEYIQGIQQDGMYDQVPMKKQTRSVTQKDKTYKVTYEGNIGRNLVTPRGLNSSLLSQYVGIQGIVTKMTIIRPKLQRSVHYCEKTDKGHIKEYDDEFDLTSAFNPNQSKTIPLKDQEGNALYPEFGYWNLKDYQSVIVQEFPEKAPTGLLPRSINIILEDDLVDKVKPGDRVQVMGVFKAIASQSTIDSGQLRTRLIATSIRGLSEEEYSNEVTTDDIIKIKEISKELKRNNQNFLNYFANSIAPCLYGHEHIKKAILLQQLGGLEKNLETVHLRGDINILMIGDPSTAKSQMLRYVMNIAPLAINTTGKGSSGVGLTAAIKIDRETGQRSLEAGAMVIADRGIVCIDEFDKMDEIDRVAMHEAMEQQTVTIAKAGIHCSLNARCSVIAAANPFYGEYQKDLTPSKNIQLPDSILSRFDLLFIVLDDKDNPELDALIAERVTKNHRYITRQQASDAYMGIGYDEDDFTIEPQLNEKDESSEKKVYEKTNKQLYGNPSTPILTQAFLKSYIQYAKKTFKPKLEEKSIEYLSKIWTNLRKKDLDETRYSGGVKVMPITIRTYETLIRLSYAHAKLRLSNKVEIDDCKEAVQLLSYALFNNVDEDWIENPDDFFDDDDDMDSFKDSNYKGNYSGKKAQQQSSRQTRSHKKQDEGMDVEEKKSSSKQKQASIKTSAGKSQQQVQIISQPQQQQQQSQKTRSQQKKQMDQIVQGIQKINLERQDENEAEWAIDQNILASVPLTRDQKKKVFVHLTQLQDKYGMSIKLNDLWDNIQNVIPSKNVVQKALFELEKENKVSVEWQKDPIIIYMV